METIRVLSSCRPRCRRKSSLLEGRLREAIGPIHLVGHSYGGALAFKFATDSPLASRVRSLTLIEPVLPTILHENGPDRPLYEHFVRLAYAVSEDLWNGLASDAIDKFLAFWKGSEAREDISPKARMRMIEHAEKLAFDFTAVLAEKNVTASRGCDPRADAAGVGWTVALPHPADLMAIGLGNPRGQDPTRPGSGPYASCFAPRRHQPRHRAAYFTG